MSRTTSLIPYREVLGVPCTACPAQAGEPCVTGAGKPYAPNIYGHKDRKNQARLARLDLAIMKRVPGASSVACPKCGVGVGEDCLKADKATRFDKDYVHDGRAKDYEEHRTDTRVVGNTWHSEAGPEPTGYAHDAPPDQQA